MTILRVLLTIAIFLLLIGAFLLYFRPIPPPTKIQIVQFGPEILNMYQQARGDTDQFFQLGVIVLGGVWTVTIVGKDTRIRRGDWIESAWLLVSCILFAFFFISYQHYRELFGGLTSDFLKINRLPDPNDTFFKDEAARVAKFFYMAVAASGCTVLGLCMKRNNDKE
jgi:hypothetical protein